MQHRSRSLMLMGSVFILGALARSSLALVCTGGLDHTTAPGVDPDRRNVGLVSIGSGAYLGDLWVLARHHLCQRDHPHGPRVCPIACDHAYREIPGTAQRIEYGSDVDTDLVMLRIDDNPAPTLIDISNNAPLSQEVTVIATGQSRVEERGYFGDGYIGFETEPTRAKWSAQHGACCAGYERESLQPRPYSNVSSSYEMMHEA